LTQFNQWFGENKNKNDLMYFMFFIYLDPNLDGIDQWDSLKTGQASKRTEFVYNIDDLQPENCGHAAIR
jgi:hypothetical protein